MFFDEIKLAFGYNLVMGNCPSKLTLERVAEKCEQHPTDVESYGLFDTSQPNYTTYYNDITADDLTPKDSDFIEPIYRALSEVIVHKNWNPVDFSMGGVLKKSMPLLMGQTIYPDHEPATGNALGAVSGVGWQNAYTTPNGIKVPAGINAKMKVDGKSNPRIARGIMMDPPSIHSTSVTVQFLWDKSHALDDNEFFSKLGTFDKDGKMIRRIATSVKNYKELSFVPRGADPYAQKTDEKGRIVNPQYAHIAYNSEQLTEFRKTSKFFYFDWKQDVLANSENTIPIESNDNNNEKMKEILLAFAAALGVTGENPTQEAVLAAITTRSTELTNAQSQVTQLTATATTNQAEITRLKALETELIALKASNPTAAQLTALEAFKTQVLTDKRAKVTEVYNKLKDNKPDTSITTMIAAAEGPALDALLTEYQTQLEAKFPAKCGKCGSTSITRASAVNPGEDPGKTLTNKDNSEVSASLEKELRRKQTMPLNKQPEESKK